MTVESNSGEVQRIFKELERIRSYTPKVGVFGDTGVGKSSLCNALFGREIAKISDVEACTRSPQEILLGEQDKGGIVLVDVPGVGEDPVRHDEYIALYKSLAPKLDLVLWAIKADDRKYLSALSVYAEVLKPNIASCPVVFVITQVDKIEPHREWNVESNTPGPKQMANLAVKINDISARFDVSTNKIVAVSSSDKYNLIELVNKVVEVLPNEKKFAFAREAKEENVSEEAAKIAEKGVWDHLRDFAGHAWEAVQSTVVPIIIESAKKALESAGKAAWKVITSWKFW